MKPSSIKKTDKYSELIGLKYGLRAACQQFNERVEAIMARIDKLLPAEDETRYQRQKNYDKKDWADFLKK